MKVSLKFERIDEYWHLTQPTYGHKLFEREMVAGADVMLDILTDKGDECVVDVYDEKPWFETTVLEKIEDRAGGADYMVTYKNCDLTHKAWLCEVVKTIFGVIPDKLYIH